MRNPSNDAFLIDEFERLTPAGLALDYGCGSGQLIAQALNQQHDFWGTEAYYGDPTRWQPTLQPEPTAADRIGLLDAQMRMPFADAHFDFVCSNQVIEHVEDIEVTAAEIARVTKSGGWNVHLFPTVETIVEKHLGVPLYHRTPRRLRAIWARPWHRLGVALYAHEIPDWSSWFDERNGFFEEQVHLRRCREIVAAFAPYFDVRPIEVRKLNFHRGWHLAEGRLGQFVELRRAGAALEMHRY